MIKILKRQKNIKRKVDKNFKKASALVENILMIAITLVLIVVLFYPQIIKLFNKAMDSLSIWFDNSISIIGIVN